MTSSKRHPEALNEARRRVHHLIDEAFSLVGLSKNAVSPLATDEATSTADDKVGSSRQALCLLLLFI